MRNQIQPEDILRKYGPRSSSFVIEKLVAAGLSADAARKRISRAEVERLSISLLPDRANFLFLEHQATTDQFYENLLIDLLKSGAVYGDALLSIIARNGCVTEKLFPTFSGGPVELRKKKVGAEIILNNLIQARLLRRVKSGSLEDLIVWREWDKDESKARACLRAEEVIIQGMRNWFARIGLLSYDSICVRAGSEKKPVYAGYQWDLTSPSYAFPLATRQSKEFAPGFFVADVIFPGELRKEHFQYFFRKCESIRANPRNKPFMAMLIAEHYENSAFKEFKGKGYLLTTVENLFGEEFKNSLLELIRILSDAGVAVASSPDKLADLLDGLNKIEGTSLNIRGALFEVLTAYCVKQWHGGYVDMQKKFRIDDKKAEVDVFWYSSNKVVAIECKGKSTSQVTVAEIDRWLKHTIPVVRGDLLRREEQKEKDMVFEFWTTGMFSPEAEGQLIEAKKQATKFEILWRDRNDLEQELSHRKMNSAKRLLNEHYS